MTRFGFIVRLFMFSACLVPFTSTRQAEALLALAPTAPIQTAPAPQEDDSERVEQAGREKERTTRPRLGLLSGNDRAPHLVPLAPRFKHRLKAIAGPAPLDHFRNGLGSPYRC